MINPIDAARNVTKDLGGTWTDLGNCGGANGRGMACCPAHPDKTPSLMITPGRKAVLYHCFAGCPQDKIIEALRNRRIGAKVDTPLPDTTFVKKDQTDFVRQIWNSAQSVQGTLAERYLALRGLLGAPGGRFVPRATTYQRDVKLHLPALILPFECSRGITAIQRIFLDPETGGKTRLLGKAKRNLGEPRNGAIRFGRVLDGVLNLAEGPEDAWSVMRWKHLPGCWSVCGNERYALLEIPEDVHTIRVWSQHGGAAARGLEKARDHLTANGRRLFIEMPPEGGDWNDAWVDQIRPVGRRPAA